MSDSLKPTVQAKNVIFDSNSDADSAIKRSEGLDMIKSPEDLVKDPAAQIDTLVENGKITSNYGFYLKYFLATVQLGECRILDTLRENPTNGLQRVQESFNLTKEPSDSLLLLNLLETNSNLEKKISRHIQGLRAKVNKEFYQVLFEEQITTTSREDRERKLRELEELVVLIELDTRLKELVTSTQNLARIDQGLRDMLMRTEEMKVNQFYLINDVIKDQLALTTYDKDLKGEEEREDTEDRRTDLILMDKFNVLLKSQGPFFTTDSLLAVGEIPLMKELEDKLALCQGEGPAKAQLKMLTHIKCDIVKEFEDIKNTMLELSEDSKLQALSSSSGCQAQEELRRLPKGQMPSKELILLVRKVVTDLCENPEDGKVEQNLLAISQHRFQVQPSIVDSMEVKEANGQKSSKEDAES